MVGMRVCVAWTGCVIVGVPRARCVGKDGAHGCHGPPPRQDALANGCLNTLRAGDLHTHAQTTHTHAPTHPHTHTPTHPHTHTLTCPHMWVHAHLRSVGCAGNRCSTARESWRAGFCLPSLQRPSCARPIGTRSVSRCKARPSSAGTTTTRRAGAPKPTACTTTCTATFACGRGTSRYGATGSVRRSPRHHRWHRLTTARAHRRLPPQCPATMAAAAATAAGLCVAQQHCARAPRGCKLHASLCELFIIIGLGNTWVRVFPGSRTLVPWPTVS